MVDLLKITQDGPNRRYVEMAEHLYDSLMPAIRTQMVRDGYEYYNVKYMGNDTYRYLYLQAHVYQGDNLDA